jgi:hypothetical protein
MKKILLLLTLLGLTFLGCSENFNDTIVSGANTTENPTLSKIEDEELYTSQLIDGKKGGKIILDETYINGEGRVINVFVKLKIPRNAFEGTREIAMLPNPDDATIQFFPHMTFNKVVKLKYVITGLDLRAMGYTHGNHDFAFFSDDGDTQIIQSRKSHVNLNQNKIKVRNAKLHHFSRYGWIR